MLDIPGGVLPYKGLMGTCGQPGDVFRDFCLNQGIDLSIFVLNRTSFLDRAVNSFVIANGLNKKEFRYLLLSYTGYGFGLNVLNRVSKSEFCLKQGRKISDICFKQGQGMRGRAAPPHQGIYRVPPRAGYRPRREASRYISSAMNRPGGGIVVLVFTKSVG